MQRMLSIWGGLLIALSSTAHAQDYEELNRELTDIEGMIESVASVPLRAEAQRSPTYVEERLTDGQLYFNLQDYQRASIIFTDIVENHVGHAAYPDALFLLGESLFRAGDYLGARSRFQSVLDRASDSQFRPYIQRALGRLIEISIRIRDFTGVEGYFQALNQLPPSEVAATTRYFRGKFLYNQGVPEDEVVGEDGELTQAEVDMSLLTQAQTEFEAVPEGGDYSLQARYFVGVIQTLRGQYPAAIEAFRQVLRTPADSPEETAVVELTQLALGRLYYETDQLEQAVEAYQAVPRTSTHFDVALYEIAWVFIRLGDATRAERSLEVLSVAAPDSKLIPDAEILRGNLLLRNGRLGCAEDAPDDALCDQGARAVFHDVRERFGPVYEALEAVRTEHADLGGHFRELVRDNMEHFDMNMFLPEEARRWTDFEGSEFDRALGVLSDLAEARQMVVETDRLAHRLHAAIHAPNRVGIFADLREQREVTTAARNRLARVRQTLVDAEFSGEGSGEIAEVRRQRRRIEDVLSEMPVDAEGFEARDAQLMGRWQRLQRELSDMEVELLGMQARIVATERFVADSGAEVTNTAEINAELETQRAAIESYRAEISELEDLIEIGRIQVGVGDDRYERDERLREEYARLIDRERQLGGGSSEATPLFERIRQIESRIAQRDAEVDAIVEERVASMTEVIHEEMENLNGYRQTIESLEGETEEVVGQVAHTSFLQVRDRFYDIVLRADVGVIDVAWTQREEHRMRVEMLTRERSRELQALDDEFRDIMDQRRPEDEVSTSPFGGTE